MDRATPENQAKAIPEKEVRVIPETLCAIVGAEYLVSKRAAAEFIRGREPFAIMAVNPKNYGYIPILAQRTLNGFDFYLIERIEFPQGNNDGLMGSLVYVNYSTFRSEPSAFVDYLKELGFNEPIIAKSDYSLPG